jgi:hypothetical protein
LRIDRQRVIEELTRNKRLVAWTQARIDEAKINVAPRNRPALPQLSSQIDNDMKDYFEVSLAEDELNLADAHKRRALLVDEKSLIDQKMVSHETLIERLREALDGD